MLTLLSPRLTGALGWTLLHSLWQGAAFALLLGVVLVALRSYSAQARYAISVGLLGGFFLTAGTTFYVQWGAAGVGPANQWSAGRPAATPPAAAPTAALPPVPTAATAPVPAAPTPFLSRLSTYYQRHLPLLVTLWLVGVLALQLRWLGQLALVQRLRHYGTSALPADWVQRAAALEDKLRLRRAVSYRTSLRAASPMVIGWLRPVVLLPQAMLTQLTESELYAVLAHELAHVRRDDFAVNLAQTLLTNVFFFHPGVWWMSARVDDEREHCCDDLAVEATGDALPYARTLVNVSDWVRGGLPEAACPERSRMGQNSSNAGRAAAPALAPAFTGKRGGRRDDGGFGARVRRLFTSQAGVGTFREGFATALILTGALALSAAASGRAGAGAGTEAPPTAAASGETSGAASVSPADPTAGCTVAASLVRACYRGDLAEVRRLVEDGADVNGEVGGDCLTPLIAAASANRVRVAAYLLDNGGEVDAVAAGTTALLEAADEGSLETLALLLERGASLHYSAGPDAPTALALAASEGRLRCLAALLDAGAVVDGFGDSRPPLHAAANEGQLPAVAILLHRGADIDHTDGRGRTALMLAAAEGRTAVVGALLDAGADATLRDRTRRTARDYALAEDQYRAAVLLGADEEGLPEDWEDRDWDRPEGIVYLPEDFNPDDEGLWQIAPGVVDSAELERLVAEAMAGIDTAEMRLSVAEAIRGVHIDAAAIRADVARAIAGIDTAEMRRSIREARRYAQEYQRPSEPYRRQYRQEYPRQYQQQYQRYYRLDSPQRRSGYVIPADSLRRLRLGRTVDSPLLDALERVDRPAIERLLEEGADVNARRDWEASATYLAVQSGDDDLLRRLIARGADVSAAPKRAWTPLHLAAVASGTETIRLLLEAGAEVDARRPYSSSVNAASTRTGGAPTSFTDATPLFVAVYNGRTAIVRQLLAAGADAGLEIEKVTWRKASAEELAARVSDYVDTHSVRAVADRTPWSALRQAEQDGNDTLLALLRG